MRSSECCNQVHRAQAELLLSSQLEARQTNWLYLWLNIYLHKMSWMSYSAISDFAACPDSICSWDKLLCSWRHLQRQLYHREEKLNLLENDQMLSWNKALTRRNAEREFFSLFFSRSPEQQKQLVSEIIHAVFTLHLLHDALRLWAFALLYSTLQLEEGRQEHTSVCWISLFTVISDVVPVKYYICVSRSFWKPIQFVQGLIMDIMSWDFVVVVAIFCAMST